MTAEVEILVGEYPNVLAVPIQAIASFGRKKFVFVESMAEVVKTALHNKARASRPSLNGKSLTSPRKRIPLSRQRPSQRHKIASRKSSSNQ